MYALWVVGHGDPQRVADHSAVGLVAASQSGEDRQTGSVRRGPAFGPQRVRAQVPHRPAVGMPACALARGRVELEELAVTLAQDDHVPVTAPLDRGVWRDRVGAGIRLVGLVERDRNERLRGGHADVRNAVLAIPAEVGPQRHRAERADVVVRGVHRSPRDVLVPGVVRREDRAAANHRRAAGRSQGKHARDQERQSPPDKPAAGPFESTFRHAPRWLARPMQRINARTATAQVRARFRRTAYCRLGRSMSEPAKKHAAPSAVVQLAAARSRTEPLDGTT